MSDKANRPVSSLGSHALTISMGVKVINNGAQCTVTVFEGGRFPEDIVIALAREALSATPETAFDRWTGPLVAYSPVFPDGTPDNTASVLFVKIKEKK